MLKRLIVLLAAASLIFAAGCSGAANTTNAASTSGAPAAASTPTGMPNTGYPATNLPELAVITPEAPTDYPAPGVTPTTASAVDGAATPGEDNGSAFPPAPGDESMNQGPFFVDSAAIQTSEDQPGYFDLGVEGSLPTPCNQPRVRVTPPDDQNRIVVEAYSVSEPGKMCTQVIKPFTGRIATLGGYPSGTYTVMLNENQVGEITLP